MKGFTLIELLVVVIIIGILAGIAIPQYELVVEKSRASEALINAKAIRDAVDRHQQEYPEEGVQNFDQIADVEIKGVISTEGNTKKTTKYFIYEFYEGCGAATYTCFGVTRRDDEYTVSYEKDGPRSPWYIDEITMASDDYQQVTDLFRENI